MPFESAYYDTCVFANASNSAHTEYASCKDVVDPMNIQWAVHVCSELICAEARIEELLRAFEVQCALNGIVWVDVLVVGAKAEQRNWRAEKKALSQLGFQSRDWTHLMAALHSAADVLISTDDDFWDPANKRNRGAAKKGIQVKRLIESGMNIRILLPSEV